MQELVVGILGARVSPEVQRVRAALERRGARALLADLSGFPAVQRASMTLESMRVGGSS